MKQAARTRAGERAIPPGGSQAVEEMQGQSRHVAGMRDVRVKVRGPRGEFSEGGSLQARPLGKFAAPHWPESAASSHFPAVFIEAGLPLMLDYFVPARLGLGVRGRPGLRHGFA